MPYDIPNLAVEQHTRRVGMPVPWWRSVVHTQTPLAVGVFLDELAGGADRDPVEWRRTLLANHPRHRGVPDPAAEKAGGGSPFLPGRSSGVAAHQSFGAYVAQVAEAPLPRAAASRWNEWYAPWTAE